MSTRSSFPNECRSNWRNIIRIVNIIWRNSLWGIRRWKLGVVKIIWRNSWWRYWISNLKEAKSERIKINGVWSKYDKRKEIKYKVRRRIRVLKYQNGTQYFKQRWLI